MKKQLTVLALAIGMLLSFGAKAQNQSQKIGYINADELLQMMPETKAAQKQLQDYQAQLQKDLTDMQQEYQNKLNDFQKNKDMWTKLTLDTKTKEIQDLQNRIQDYGSKAQEDLQNKQVELLSPIIDKATKAVQDVAKENGFAYILDSSESKAVVIYAGGGTDIMPLVKKKLGLE